MRRLRRKVIPALVFGMACGADSPGPVPLAPLADAASLPTWRPSAAGAGLAPTEAGAVSRKGTRFVAVGDTGTGASGQYEVSRAIDAKCRADGCDFVQLLGDNLYPSGAASADDPIWREKFENPYAAIDLDFFAVLGNHDYGHDGAGTDPSKGKHEVEYSTRSRKWKMPSAHYHFTKGKAEFFALDTNAQMFGIDDEQRRDVARWISASTATWKIVVGHHPYRSNGPHGNAGEYDRVPIPGPWTGSGVKQFFEDVVCGRVDLYLSAHDHSRQWLRDGCRGTALAVSGAGARPTHLPGKNPVLFQSRELGFVYVIVEPQRLTVQFVDVEGRVEHTEEARKETASP